jgi:hypothetical protein
VGLNREWTQINANENASTSSMAAHAKTLRSQPDQRFQYAVIKTGLEFSQPSNPAFCVTEISVHSRPFAV